MGVTYCDGCRLEEPDWPAGWLFTDDDRRYCPPCRKNVYLLRALGIQIGNAQCDGNICESSATNEPPTASRPYPPHIDGREDA